MLLAGERGGIADQIGYYGCVRRLRINTVVGCDEVTRWFYMCVHRENTIEVR